MQREPSPSAPHQSHVACCALARYRVYVVRAYDRFICGFDHSYVGTPRTAHRTPKREGAQRPATPCAGAVSCYLRVGVEYRVVCGRAVLTTMGWLHGVSRSADWAIRVNRDAARPTKGAVVGATPRADPQEENHIHVHHHSMHACTHLRSEVERAHWGRCCRALLPGRLIVHHQSCRQSSGAQSCRRPSDTRASLVSMFVG